MCSMVDTLIFYHDSLKCMPTPYFDDLYRSATSMEMIYSDNVKNMAQDYDGIG